MLAGYYRPSSAERKRAKKRVAQRKYRHNLKLRSQRSEAEQPETCQSTEQSDSERVRSNVRQWRCGTSTTEAETAADDSSRDSAAMENLNELGIERQGAGAMLDGEHGWGVDTGTVPAAHSQSHSLLPFGTKEHEAAPHYHIHQHHPCGQRLQDPQQNHQPRNQQTASLDAASGELSAGQSRQAGGTGMSFSPASLEHFPVQEQHQRFAKLHLQQQQEPKMELPAVNMRSQDACGRSPTSASNIPRFAGPGPDVCLQCGVASSHPLALDANLNVIFPTRINPHHLSCEVSACLGQPPWNYPGQPASGASLFASKITTLTDRASAPQPLHFFGSASGQPTPPQRPPLFSSTVLHNHSPHESTAGSGTRYPTYSPAAGPAAGTASDFGSLGNRANSKYVNGHGSSASAASSSSSSATPPSSPRLQPQHSPLFQAARAGNVKILALLVERTASLGVTDHAGQTLLHVVAQQGHHEAARFLLGCGLDVDVYDHGGRTPLYLAVVNGWEKVVEVLVGAGADVDIERPRSGSGLGSDLNRHDGTI